MHKVMHKIMGVALAATSFQVLAVEIGSIPEPGALSLLGIGAVAGLVVWSRKRQNKK